MFANRTMTLAGKTMNLFPCIGHFSLRGWQPWYSAVCVVLSDVAVSLTLPQWSLQVITVTKNTVFNMLTKASIASQ